jgi:hypothetical protein
VTRQRGTFLFKTLLFGVIFGLLVVSLGLKIAAAHAQNVSINSARNCDANAVIYCGAGTVDELIGKYRGGDGRNTATSIHNIYSYFGISSAAINGMNSPSVNVEAGSVTSSGDVYGSNNQLVATNALTGGREYRAGSKQVSSGGTSFYTRPPRVSFVSSQLSAFVVMKNGQFVFAILASCGNPVIATPVKHASTPTPKLTQTTAPTTSTATLPPAMTTTVPNCSGNNNASNSIASQGNCSTNTTVVETQIQSSSPPPFAQCTSLQTQVSNTDSLSINSTANYQIGNGAQLESAVFNFGDGTTSPASTQTSQNHTYAQPGSYPVTATLTFSADNQVIGSSICQTTVTVSLPPTPSTTATTTSASTTPPTTPITSAAPATSLVNTGPGDIIGLFAASSTIGSIAYLWIMKRRLV